MRMPQPPDHTELFPTVSADRVRLLLRESSFRAFLALINGPMSPADSEIHDHFRTWRELEFTDAEVRVAMMYIGGHIILIPEEEVVESQMADADLVSADE